MSDLVYQYYSYYIRASVHFWNVMGPYEYGGILLIIGFVGWLLMKGHSR
jgi:hypothetical protein